MTQCTYNLWSWFSMIWRTMLKNRAPMWCYGSFGQAFLGFASPVPNQRCDRPSCQGTLIRDQWFITGLGICKAARLHSVPDVILVRALRSPESMVAICRHARDCRLAPYRKSWKSRRLDSMPLLSGQPGVCRSRRGGLGPASSPYRLCRKILRSRTVLRWFTASRPELPTRDCASLASSSRPAGRPQPQNKSPSQGLGVEFCGVIAGNCELRTVSNSNYMERYGPAQLDMACGVSLGHDLHSLACFPHWPCNAALWQTQARDVP